MKKCDCNQLNCDDIDWLVDVLGSSYVIMGMTGIEARKSTRRGVLKDPGLYYDGAHWYSKPSVDKPKTDSYSQNHQIKGTAHFCQTFAMMYFLNENKNFKFLNKISAGLKPHQYANNIRVAMKWWISALQNLNGLDKIMINEIKAIGKERKQHNLRNKNKLPLQDARGKLLTRYTINDLIIFLQCVYGHAESLIGCKEGF